LRRGIPAVLPFSKMSLTYPAAMAELQTMFPTMDKSVLHVVLESNGGHMEATIGCLLQMTTDDSSKKKNDSQIVITSSPKAPSPSHASSSSSSASASNYASYPHATQSAPAPPPKAVARAVPNSGAAIGGSSTLPDDFLRPPSYFKSQGSPSGGGAPSQMDQDAQLAAMLQDEMFMQDLMKRPDIYMAAAGLPSFAPPRNANPNAPATASSASAPGHQGEKISEKFAHLGAAAKAKLAVIASKFKRTKKGGGGILNPSAQYRDLDHGEEGAVNAEDDIEMNDKKKKERLPTVPDM